MRLLWRRWRRRRRTNGLDSHRLKGQFKRPDRMWTMLGMLIVMSDLTLPSPMDWFITTTIKCGQKNWDQQEAKLKPKMPKRDSRKLEISLTKVSSTCSFGRANVNFVKKPPN